MMPMRKKERGKGGVKEFRQDFFLSCICWTNNVAICCIEMLRSFNNSTLVCSAGVFCVVVAFGFYQVYLHVMVIHGFDQFCGSTILEILNFVTY